MAVFFNTVKYGSSVLKLNMCVLDIYPICLWNVSAKIVYGSPTFWKWGRINVSCTKESPFCLNVVTNCVIRKYAAGGGVN